MQKWAQGSKLLWQGMLALLALGCADAGPEPTASPSPAAISADFNPATAGTIRGRVTWAGILPVVPPFEYRRNLPSGNPAEPRLVRENPNAPAINPQRRAVAGAVVMLHGIDAGHARPWDLPPVRIEHRERRLHIVQGESDGKVGFVRQGDAVEFVSREPEFNTLRASGAAFFSLTLPDPDQPRRRMMAEKGLVELNSGAGWYWMRAYVFVDEHPYYMRTDAEGRFCLTGVPPGEYQLSCWMPNWNVGRHERDPETTVITRIFFRPPVQQDKPVKVHPAMTTTVDFTRTASEFNK
jgi:hypothetical protein